MGEGKMKVKTKLDTWRELPAIKEYSEKYGSFTVQDIYQYLLSRNKRLGSKNSIANKLRRSRHITRLGVVTQPNHGLSTSTQAQHTLYIYKEVEE
jgi:hypothetical protein|tara:strand:- start:428 stop:712 length:285 start_codon:yes stop_codon:yes gene_type:complete